MKDNEYPCVDCLFILTCNSACAHARTFEMTTTKLKRTGRCPYCGNKIKYSKYGTTGQKVECTLCKFSWII